MANHTMAGNIEEKKTNILSAIRPDRLTDKFSDRFTDRQKRGRDGSENSGKKQTRMKLLVGVVSTADAVQVTEICNSVGAALSYSFEASGTARTAVLDYLGIGETLKRVILSLIPESAEKAVLEGIQKGMALYLVGKGICFTLPLTGVSSIVANGLLKASPQEKAISKELKMNKTDRKYDLVIAAMQSGYADEAMNAAREAGAAGGTLIHAATLNNRKAEQLIGITLQNETEILMILTKREGKLAIMRAIQQTAGLKTDAGGVLFSLPVDNLVGVGAMSPELPDEKPTEKHTEKPSDSANKPTVKPTEKHTEKQTEKPSDSEESV